MATTKYPWLPPGTTTEQAQAEAMRIMHARCRRFGGRHNITARVEDSYIGELRRYPRRSRKAGLKQPWKTPAEREQWWQRRREVG